MVFNQAMSDFLPGLELTPLLGGYLVLGQFSPGAYNDHLYTAYKIEFPPALRRAVAKRRAEFIAGRVAANHGLEQLQFGKSRIARGSHGEPLWPPGAVGSISHSHNKVASLVGNKPNRFAGVDIEAVINPESCRKIASQVLTSQDSMVLECMADDFAVLFTIVFSAKESLFKALFPRVGRYFGFDAVSVSDTPTGGKVVLVLEQDLPGGFSVGDKFVVQYFFWKKAVVTWIYG